MQRQRWTGIYTRKTMRGVADEKKRKGQAHGDERNPVID